jgi:hypothetical protein
MPSSTPRRLLTQCVRPVAANLDRFMQRASEFPVQSTARIGCCEPRNPPILAISARRSRRVAFRGLGPFRNDRVLRPRDLNLRDPSRIESGGYSAGLAATCERQSYDSWKQLLFELLTNIVSCQAICTRRRFSSDCLLARMRQKLKLQSGRAYRTVK